MYEPDNWVVIKVKGDDPHYRVLAGWSGGYITSDSWRMNSGITRVKEDEHSFYFYGATGSCYKCRKTAYRLRMNNAHIWAALQEQHGDKVEIMDGGTKWAEVDWIVRDNGSGYKHE
jgi:hypothetical protein